MHRTFKPLLATLALAFTCGAFAQEAAIRKTLAERLPNVKIDEITRSPVAGLWEVRYGGTEIMYADEKGEFVFVNGSLVDTKTRTDLTEARIEKLLAIAFDDLPLKDAVLVKQGDGSRKMAVFVDPNCGYCKRFERDIAAIKDVSIYTFLIPILGADSTAKSRDIWCAKDQVQAWRGWMLDNVTPQKALKCDTAAIDRNLKFAQKQRINGTPAVIFADGTRKPGAIPGAMVERLLVAAAAASAPKK
jgi:thiol:disulfide interchange protein DsbC